MIYFIPAWYQQNQWCENEQSWHARRMKSEFDDTVKHIQLFHRSKAYPYRILLLGFAPNFRHFLHRQSVYHAPYWSCFDAIQEVRRETVALLSFHNLQWPEQIEFVYTPFVVVAMLNGEKYAQIGFGEDGNPIQIDLYQKGQISRRNYYDDRGFVSSTVLYEEGKPVYQDYLTEKGIWKIRCFMEDGRLAVNPGSNQYLLKFGDQEQTRSFKRSSYEGLEQVIAEVFSAFLELTDKADIFCAAMHGLHTGLLKEALEGRRVILSFYRDRYKVTANEKLTEVLEMVDYLITDSRETTQIIKEKTGKDYHHIRDITPFDSRVDHGISQQLPVQKILVPVDGLEAETFQELVNQLGQYLLENKNAQVHLFTRQAEYNRNDLLLNQTSRYLETAGFPAEWAAREDDKETAENPMDRLQSIPVRFYAEQCVDELSVSKCMREQRVMVDMRNFTDLYLRITAISVGIPQIVYQANQFVEDRKNGWVLQETGLLSQVLHYYLDSLTNWNEAMICSYEMGKKYTTEVLVEKWKEVIEIVGYNSNPAAGKGRLESDLSAAGIS